MITCPRPFVLFASGIKGVAKRKNGDPNIFVATPYPHYQCFGVGIKGRGNILYGKPNFHDALAHCSFFTKIGLRETTLRLVNPTDKVANSTLSVLISYFFEGDRQLDKWSNQ